MRSRIKALASAALALALLGAAPSVADLDASARAAGNRIGVATTVGRSVFRTTWPVQVSQLSANELDGHLILGVRLWGVKFHRPITRQEFVAQIVSIVSQAFAAAPKAEEVDVWASVPIEVGKDVVVTGDLAKPTSRTVFSLTVRRGESGDSVAARTDRSAGVFWDAAWARTAFKKQGA